MRACAYVCEHRVSRQLSGGHCPSYLLGLLFLHLYSNLSCIGYWSHLPISILGLQMFTTTTPGSHEDLSSGSHACIEGNLLAELPYQTC